MLERMRANDSGWRSSSVVCKNWPGKGQGFVVEYDDENKDEFQIRTLPAWPKKKEKLTKTHQTSLSWIILQTTDSLGFYAKFAQHSLSK